MPDSRKVIEGLEKCTLCLGCCPRDCPYYDYAKSCSGVQVKKDALELLNEQIKTIFFLREDIEVWKKRYKVMVLECKSSEDPNKEPNIVKHFTTEEVEQGKAVAWPNG